MKYVGIKIELVARVPHLPYCVIESCEQHVSTVYSSNSCHHNQATVGCVCRYRPHAMTVQCGPHYPSPYEAIHISTHLVHVHILHNLCAVRDDTGL